MSFLDDLRTLIGFATYGVDGYLDDESYTNMNDDDRKRQAIAVMENFIDEMEQNAPDTEIMVADEDGNVQSLDLESYRAFVLDYIEENGVDDFLGSGLMPDLAELADRYVQTAAPFKRKPSESKRPSDSWRLDDDPNDFVYEEDDDDADHDDDLDD